MVNQLAYCPRCDKPFPGKTSTEALEVVKVHVAKAHPGYDPDWAEKD